MLNSQVRELLPLFIGGGLFVSHGLILLIDYCGGSVVPYSIWFQLKFVAGGFLLFIALIQTDPVQKVLIFLSDLTQISPEGRRLAYLSLRHTRKKQDENPYGYTPVDSMSDMRAKGLI